MMLGYINCEAPIAIVAARTGFVMCRDNYL